MLPPSGVAFMAFQNFRSAVMKVASSWTARVR